MRIRENLCKKIDNSKYLGKLSKKVLKWVVMNLNNNQQINYSGIGPNGSYSSNISLNNDYSLQATHSESWTGNGYSYQTPNIYLDIQNCGIQGNIYNSNNSSHF